MLILFYEKIRVAINWVLQVVMIPLLQGKHSNYVIHIVDLAPPVLENIMELEGSAPLTSNPSLVYFLYVLVKRGGRNKTWQ